MLTLIYHPDGVCVSDAKTMEYALGLSIKANQPNEQHSVVVAQAMIIDAVRVLIKRGMINHTLIQFKFNDHLITSDVGGHLSDFPRGFCDHTENYLLELLS